MPRLWCAASVGKGTSFSSIFCCGNRSLLMHARGPAPSGRNQLQAPFVLRLTDTLARIAANIAKLPELLRPG